MGSGAARGANASGRSRGSWNHAADEPVERREREYSVGGGYRPGESGGNERGPQFLVEADDGDGYGGGRLVAPPVLGESPAGFRDF